MRKKYGLAMIAALFLSGSCAVTLSYFSDSETAVNSFTFIGEKGLDAVLTEPSWKPEQASLVVPNTVIPKDPQVTNTSEADLDELVALKMEFIYTDTCPDIQKRGQTLSEADMEYVRNIFQIDYNAEQQEDWVRFDGENAAMPVQHFYYKYVLKRNLPGQGETTKPLFTEITVDRTVENELFSHIQEIGGFDIRISGHVLQYMEGESYFGLNSAKEAYEAGRFVFDSEEVGAFE